MTDEVYYICRFCGKEVEYLEFGQLPSRRWVMRLSDTVIQDFCLPHFETSGNSSHHGDAQKMVDVIADLQQMRAEFA